MALVTQTEIRMVESLMQRMHITGDDRQRAIRLFNQGKQADFDLEKTLHAFAQHSMVRQDLRQMFMEILVEAAFSSGNITQAEHEVLFSVARSLRIPGQVFSAMLNARGGAAAAVVGWRRATRSPGSRWVAWRRPMPNWALKARRPTPKSKRPTANWSASIIRTSWFPADCPRK